MNRLKLLASIVSCGLMLAVPKANAQTWEDVHARSIILLGSGGDVTHTLTLQAPSLSGSSTLTFPSANASGFLSNDGSGTLTWSTLVASSLTPGSNNTFLVTNGSSSVTWLGLNADATLTGNGIASALGINLAHANTWAAAQTFPSITSPVLYGGSAAGSALNLQSTSNGSPSGDYVTVTAGGIERMRVTSTGIGIGTTTPGASFEIQSTFALGDDSITINGGAVNNDVGTGTATVVHIGLTGTAAPSTITGFLKGTDGQLLELVNLTGQTLTLANQTGSATQNQIISMDGGDMVIANHGTIALQWDDEINGWYVFAYPGNNSVAAGRTGLTTLTQNGILYGNGTGPIGVTSAAANSILVTDGSNNPSLSQTLPSAVQANITSLTGITGAITYPTALTFNGTAGRTLSLNRNTGTAAGQGLTIQAGAPASSAATNNLAGGNLTLSSGISEGTGTSSILFQTAAAGSIGNTDNAPATRMTLNATQLNLASGVELDQNGTQRISSSGAGTLASLTLGSPLTLANGGTNANLTASNGGIFYSTGSAGAILAGTATANQILLSGSSTTPAWSTATYPASTTANQLLYSSATNTIAGLTSATNGVLVTDGSGVPSIGSTLPAAVQSNITGSGTITSGTWHGGVIGLTYGGTGQATAAAAINALLPDSTSHTQQFLQIQPGGGYVWAPPSAGPGVVTSVAVSGGTTGLTTSGGPITTSGTITLAGTLAIANGGTGQTTQAAALNALLPDTTGNTAKRLTVLAGGGVGWIAGAGTGTVLSVSGSGGTTGLTLTGGPITSIGTLTLGGTLAVANGGTGQASALTAGGVVYGSSTTVMATSALGTSGQLLISGGAGAPSFTSSVSGLTITNSSIGSSSPSTGAFTTVTTPTIYGGSAPGSTLNLQSTSSGSPSGDYITFTSGGSERMRLTNGGMLGIKITPLSTLDLNGTFALRSDTVTIIGSSSNNNVSPGSTSIVHIGQSGTAGPSTITGFSGGQEGRQLEVDNFTGQTLTLANLTGSASGNQISTGSGLPVSYLSICL